MTLRAVPILILELLGVAVAGCDRAEPRGVSAAPAEAPSASVAPSARAAPSTGASVAKSFKDPFAYCAAVRDVDAPDARYTGYAKPDVVVLPGHADPWMPKSPAANARQVDDGATPADVLYNGTYWRCMDGKVQRCFVGANLPCWSKPHTEPLATPPAEIVAWCKKTPDASVPNFMQPDSVYAWTCVGEKPVGERSKAVLDARGFIADLWSVVAPP